MATVRPNADTTMKSDQQLLTPKATASRLLHPTAVKGQWRVVATTLAPPSLITVGQTFGAKTSHAVQMIVEFGHHAPLSTIRISACALKNKETRGPYVCLPFSSGSNAF